MCFSWALPMYLDMSKKIEAADKIVAIAHRVAGKELPREQGMQEAIAIIDDYHAQALVHAVDWRIADPDARARSDRQDLVEEIERRRELAGRSRAATSDFLEMLSDRLAQK